ncbi:HEPN domain-containing protein [Candidatus Korarchaeum cryptofilum]|uniref:HEPN domain-containing protein n=2 Tax=Candidatus Korarchaeum cryptofilum TaxID=498846 RepID=A0A3R9PCR2_9CREN|nr:HEPN domain-containing protein [Candidatus Korarchaeum cryptofilum]
MDPEADVELHLKLCEKYLREAEDFLARKDYVQASEKAWGAASQMLKALAAKEGRELRSHAELWKYADELAEKLGDEELRYLWRTANALHQNFYENWMPSREVELSVRDVKEFVRRLRAILNI